MSGGTTVSLGYHFETFVKSMLENGRYNSASELVRDGLRMVEARERRLAKLDVAIERGHAEAAAGLGASAAEVFDRLETKYTKMIQDDETK